MKKRKDIKVTECEPYDKFNVSSSTECTGLITVPPENEDELENYMDIYDFGPPITKKENLKSKRD